MSRLQAPDGSTTTDESRRSFRRTALWSAAAFAGAGLALYAFTPGADAGAGEIGQPGSQSGSDEAAETGPAPDESGQGDAQSGQSSAEESSATGADAPRDPHPRTLDDSARPHKPGAVPASSPYAATAQERGAREGGASEQGSAREDVARSSDSNAPDTEQRQLQRTLGADSLDDPRAFSLRMSQPIDGIRGVEEDGGFSVKIPGTLSLDRAGPIAATHPAVERSMILNRGDHAELSVRFAQGRSPRYRVVGRGRTLEVQIEQ